MYKNYMDPNLITPLLDATGEELLLVIDSCPSEIQTLLMSSRTWGSDTIGSPFWILTGASLNSHDPEAGGSEA
ncbi:hypothetical protein CH63R_12825 [Colletotrichum higginsianum IMI 349063]|uniref:Uncharacterized protein n=1 Tax=Colletotrichum higginsianum (strain IMI 349063) TaxID=759273 RepID=A0A1B7XVC8_COLHI|nr:hypothetical protein CH63R_12825 [Colletotrichum higginsianum IMI 349063]OBR03698.1 hypothetical protein CH63R_12825 [Colletotrichum higginsianum IMI 349063]